MMKEIDRWCGPDHRNLSSVRHRSPLVRAGRNNLQAPCKSAPRLSFAPTASAPGGTGARLAFYQHTFHSCFPQSS